MTTGVQSINSTQSAVLVNGVQVLLFDQTGHLLGVDTGHRDLGAVVAGGALTLSLQPVTMKFRSSTLSTGVYVQRAISTALSLVLPTGASLGSVNTITSRFVVLALDVAGTVELAVINISGGVNLDESGIISSTAISAAATSPSVLYSTTARAGVAYRVVGFVDNTQATAGTYATVPSLVQGAGALAVSALGSLGYGQTWQAVTRNAGTTYYNTTGRPIMLIADLSGTATGAMNCAITFPSSSFNLFNHYAAVAGLPITTSSIIIPISVSYSLNVSNCTIASVKELR